MAASSGLNMQGTLRARSASVSLRCAPEERGRGPGARWVELTVTDGYTPGEVAEQMREAKEVVQFVQYRVGSGEEV